MVADDRDSGMRLVGGCDVLTTGAGNNRELTTGLGSDGGSVQTPDLEKIPAQRQD